MVLPFALVEWKGDPKPDCWQVIKTSQIQANPDDICEGKCLDALWKRDEETSVAGILKLSGECEFQSLLTYCSRPLLSLQIKTLIKNEEVCELMFFFFYL